MDETAQLRNIADENKDNVATYACLSGVEKKLSSSKNSEEYITFDFIVTLPSNILTETDNLKNGIKQSVDCEIEQIRNLKITEIDDGSRNKTTRVNGKIYTDDWELPMLHKKFQKIISDRVLSGNLQKICDLEERPMIRRFWCKTSREQNKNNNNNNNSGNKPKNPLGQLQTTQSLRTLKDDTTIQDPTKVDPINKPKGKVNESVSISDNNKYIIKNDKDNDDDDRSEDEQSHEDSPHSDSPLNKKKNDEGGKGNGNNSSSSSGSKQSEGNQQTMPPRTGDDHCECFCIVL